MTKAKAAPRRTVAQVQKELDDFKAKVLEVALTEASNRGWCDEWRSVLKNKLGLSIPTRKVSVSFSFDSTNLELKEQVLQSYKTNPFSFLQTVAGYINYMNTSDIRDVLAELKIEVEES